MNDSDVSMLSNDQIKNSHPYILFYLKRGAIDPSVDVPDECNSYSIQNANEDTGKENKLTLSDKKNKNKENWNNYELEKNARTFRIQISGKKTTKPPDVMVANMINKPDKTSFGVGTDFREKEHKSHIVTNLQNIAPKIMDKGVRITPDKNMKTKIEYKNEEVKRPISVINNNRIPVGGQTPLLGPLHKGYRIKQTSQIRSSYKSSNVQLYLGYDELTRISSNIMKNNQHPNYPIRRLGERPFNFQSIKTSNVPEVEVRKVKKLLQPSRIMNAQPTINRFLN